MTEIPTLDLNDGRAIPEIGLGTYAMTGDDGVEAIGAGIESGYRLLDTAVNYENEREVGRAIAESPIDRGDLFITSKIPGRHHGFDEAIASTEESLARLGLDYLDLHLIHWPNPSVGKYVETWEGLIELRRRGLVKSIGVSNFTAEMLTELVEKTGVTPAVNQVELHPYFPQTELVAFHRSIGVQTESWSPLYRDQGLFDEAPSPRRPPPTMSPPPRWSCAGISKSVPSRSRSRRTPNASALTPPSSTSPSPPPRWLRSPGSSAVG